MGLERGIGLRLGLRRWRCVFDAERDAVEGLFLLVVHDLLDQLPLGPTHRSG